MAETTYIPAEPLNLDEFGAWLNSWAWDDLRTHEAVGNGYERRSYREGYQDAVRDIYDVFDKLHRNWAKDREVIRRYDKRHEERVLA